MYLRPRGQPGGAASSRSKTHVLRHLALIALALPALWHVITLTILFWGRMTYPMDIEWMEGGALYHAHRFTHGLDVYGAPAQGFLPYPYPPIHFVTLGLLGSVFGLDYGTGRALSIACFTLACAVTAREVWAASIGARPRAAGLERRPVEYAAAMALAAVAAVAASFPVVGGWYDLIRNDTMAIALVTLGAGLVSDARPSCRRILAAAVVLTAAVFTKQSAAFYIPWIGLFLAIRSWQKGALLAAATGLTALAALGVCLWATEGRFWMWIVTVMSKHPLDRLRFIEGTEILLGFAPFLLPLPFAALGLALTRRLSARAVLWLGMLATAIPTSLLTFAKWAAFVNHLIPVLVFAAPATLIVWADVVASVRGRPHAAATLRAAGLVAAAGFLALRRYDPEPHRITAEDRRGAAELNTLVAELRGGVIIPSHPFLAVRNGHRTPQIHDMPYQDALYAGVGGVNLPDFLRRTGARYAILNGTEGPYTQSSVRATYQPERRIDAGVATRTGLLTAPHDLLRFRPPPARVAAEGRDHPGSNCRSGPGGRPAPEERERSVR